MSNLSDDDFVQVLEEFDAGWPQFNTVAKVELEEHFANNFIVSFHQKNNYEEKKIYLATEIRRIGHKGKEYVIPFRAGPSATREDLLEKLIAFLEGNMDYRCCLCW